jgi:hypothetical protein
VRGDRESRDHNLRALDASQSSLIHHYDNTVPEDPEQSQEGASIIIEMNHHRSSSITIDHPSSIINNFASSSALCLFVVLSNSRVL